MRQLIKDFEGAGVSAENIAPAGDPKKIRGAVLTSVKEAQRGSGDQLQRLLYRVDVSEAQLRRYCDKFPMRAFEEVVAELIVMRTLQKVILKKRFSGG